MDWPDYLRDEAAKYRKLAEQTDDPVVKNELLELASVCEEVASNIEDHLTGGWVVTHAAGCRLRLGSTLLARSLLLSPMSAFTDSGRTSRQVRKVRQADL
jgi:hypothetical protein